MIRRALLSVSNKEGIVEFARGLAGLGAEIISTGGTAKLLKESGLPVRPVSEVAGFPEILDGRVKTLQPGIHGGILAIRDNPEHLRQLKEHGIEPIDLVAVNLYPFRETIARPGVSLEEALENIDIGGPTMVRAAAKNHPDVVILVNPARYGEILSELRESGRVSPQTRYRLALEAFRHTAEYDAAIAGYLDSAADALVKGQANLASGLEADLLSGNAPTGDPLTFPERLHLTFARAQDLRYGENPHQRAAFYRETGPAGATVAGASQLHGKELSFNNINDADAALELVKEFERPAAVAVKHTNPCGVAIGETLAEACRKAHDADPVSIFGGILACNRPVDEETAREAARIFLEIIIAPGFTEEALSILQKKRDLRLLATGPWGGPGVDRITPAVYDLKKVGGGLLVQELDRFDHPGSDWRVVTRKSPDGGHWDDLDFAWKVCKHVKSNAIVVAKGQKTLGVGAGQMNRIDAARHALKRAGEEAPGAVLASDAFFPFPDVVEAAAEAGIAIIVQPGGSIRDEDSIRRADELGISMVFTGVRHFRH